MTTVSVVQDQSGVDDPEDVDDGDLRVLRVREIELNLAAHLLTVDRGRPIPLPPKEFGILSVLIARAGRIVSQDQLIEQVWGPEGAPAKSIQVYMRRPRRRFEVDPHHRHYIRTVRGYGYIIDV
jgi:DNA-binding response OmpR family regulator